MLLEYLRPKSHGTSGPYAIKSGPRFVASESGFADSYGQLGDQGVVRPSELALPLIPTFCPQPQIFDAIPAASTLKAPSMTKAGTEHIVRNSREAEHRLLVGNSGQYVLFQLSSW